MANVSPVLDLRRHPRHKVLKGGKIVSLTLLSSIDVTIIDMSVRGARIRLPATSNFPEIFWLLVVPEKLLYPADVRWRGGEMTGIEFTGEPVGLTAPPVTAIAGPRSRNDQRPERNPAMTQKRPQEARFDS